MLEQIITEQERYNLLIFNHKLQENLFSSQMIINESDNVNREEIITKIRNGRWEKPQNPVSFKASMDISKHKQMLTPYSIGELAQMKLYKLLGYNIGFALKNKEGVYNEIVAVHNNEPEIKNIGEELIKVAIKKGGCYLDHFDGYLSKFYSKLGFEEYDRDKFDAQYDQDGSFRNKYGAMDVIYRKHINCKR